MNHLIDAAYGVGAFFLSGMGFGAIWAAAFNSWRTLDERAARSAGAMFGGGIGLLVISALLWWKAIA